MTDQEKSRLLTIARAALQSFLADNAVDPPLTIDRSWPDPTPRGVFVTLHRGDRLRGCIGTFTPNRPLPDTIWDMAIAAAQDPRFIDHPLSLEELPGLTIEISVLSPLQRTTDPLALQLGEHGIYIRAGHYTGCFLPEVATTCDWTAQQFLEHCCADKAGLPRDAWKDPHTEVSLFTVEKLVDAP